jgi:CelD/BcsL family acetyltransferase involved in cellulose biosynthesis
MALTVEAVRYAAGAGVREVDFLRGHEPYKFELAAQTRRVLRLRSATGWRGRLLLRALAAAESLRGGLGRLRRAGREA